MNLNPFIQIAIWLGFAQASPPKDRCNNAAVSRLRLREAQLRDDEERRSSAEAKRQHRRARNRRIIHG
jgi:hypothetical protein